MITCGTEGWNWVVFVIMEVPAVPRWMYLQQCGSALSILPLYSGPVRPGVSNLRLKGQSA